eukprot:TRINITY_DN28653_c0_g1_i1.p1 TRINITY_DN28653_c0_g1~~TRINITY_DN28653_c0_g1_i1.p1  ORF type:complete len:315 (-),score=42.08 TRINITY_DN28653_c0_g1_i1:137-1081(-)
MLFTGTTQDANDDDAGHQPGECNTDDEECKYDSSLDHKVDNAGGDLDWIFCRLLEAGWTNNQIARFCVASQSDCECWATYASSLDDEELNLFVFHSFRKRVETPQFSLLNQKTLLWLVDLYAGRRPKDVQIRNLPFTITNPDQSNLHLMYWHLEILARTIGKCAGLIHAGYLNLMSREEARTYIKKRGDFLLRVSNLKPNQLVLTCCPSKGQIRHIYLDELVTTESATPHKINGQKYVIRHWTNDGLLQWLRNHAEEYCLRKCVLGELTVDEMLNSNYETAVSTLYETVKMQENNYIEDNPRLSRFRKLRSTCG